MAESISDIEDAIKREIEFTTILANSIVARDELYEHKCDRIWCPDTLGCEEAERLSDIDGKAFQLAIDAIENRFATARDGIPR